MSSISAGTSVGTALVSTGDTTGDLVLKTGSSATTAVTIAGSNQNVGIGTSSPAHKLHVAGNAFVPLTNSYYCATADYGMGTPDSGGLQVFSGSGDSIRFGKRASGTFTENMRIDGSGNVGIGTSSIASGGAGTINFNVHTPSANTVYFKLSNAGTGNTASDGFDLLTDSSGVAYVWNRENQSLLFGTNNTERMRIRNDGGILSQPTGGGTLLEQFGCRAWVNFNGTGTVAIRASGNVSSITDNGTGDYTVNFSTAMPDANYSTQVTAQRDTSGSGVSALGGIFNSPTALTSSNVRVGTINDAGTIVDSVGVHVAIFR